MLPLRYRVCFCGVNNTKCVSLFHFNLQLDGRIFGGDCKASMDNKVLELN